MTKRNKGIMAKALLTDTGFKAIEDDADLFADVAKELNVKPKSLARMLDRKAGRFAEYNVVRLVSKATGLKPELLLKSA